MPSQKKIFYLHGTYVEIRYENIRDVHFKFSKKSEFI